MCRTEINAQDLKEFNKNLDNELRRQQNANENI